VKVELAALNNAEWCHAFCGTGTFDGPLWSSPQRTPQFYPDAVTLAPGVAAEEILARIDAGEGCSVKDSFFDVELPGFDVLFEAVWLWLERAGDDATGWCADQSAWGPSVVTLTNGGTSAIANRSERVIGISNVEGGDHLGAAAAAQRVFGSLPVVTYEREPLAGFEPIGKLRVLVRARTA
jgi:hypothetical protein